MRTARLLSLLIALGPLALGIPASGDARPTDRGAPSEPAAEDRGAVGTAASVPQPAPADTAVFAGGCFWCMEEAFDPVDGVLSTISGYAGGHVENPTYEQVVAGGTGHREVVRVVYDPSRVGYERLLEAFWVNVDPLDAGGQFCDRGLSYTTAIFARDREQARKAEASRNEVSERLAALGHEEPVATPVLTDWEFYPAEDYHQDYYQEHSIQYRFYKWRCGRVARLEEVWGEGEG